MTMEPQDHPVDRRRARRQRPAAPAHAGALAALRAAWIEHTILLVRGQAHLRLKI
jgi:hypothetical protein